MRYPRVTTDPLLAPFLSGTKKLYRQQNGKTRLIKPGNFVKVANDCRLAILLNISSSGRQGKKATVCFVYPRHVFDFIAGQPGVAHERLRRRLLSEDLREQDVNTGILILNSMTTMPCEDVLAVYNDKELAEHISTYDMTHYVVLGQHDPMRPDELDCNLQTRLFWPTM
ncbi:unnamed protein product [Peniophora sp. CBMAI 1063]|nr:unnamed protein product [Peniophora sp. CBMAI 1063]